MFVLFAGSLSARRAWIEISWVPCWALYSSRSLSARRAWIEINLSQTFARRWAVALRKESVDRNNFGRLHYNVSFIVALRKESVDRNTDQPSKTNTVPVALRKESVDRN